MLTELTIKNYALIDDLNVSFNDGLTIITGETGAGKSILLDGLGLVLGNRVDSAALRYAGEKCIIEAHFDISAYELEPFFDQHDIDYEAQTIVRREVLPSGKSRAFVNDTPTTLNVLDVLGERLIDVHSQRQTLQLADTGFQFELLDSFAGITTAVQEYRQVLNRYHSVNKALEDLKETHRTAVQQYEYNKYQFDELERAALVDGEQEKVEEELDTLNNMEAIRENLTEALGNAMEDERGLRDRLSAFRSNLLALADFSAEFRELSERMEQVKIEFDDLLAEVEHLYETMNFDSQAFERLNSRLQLLFDLQKKHAKMSVSELLVLKDELEVKVIAAEGMDDEIAAREQEMKELEESLKARADRISSSRMESVPDFEKRLEEIVANLGMENTRFRIDLLASDDFTRNGMDILVFSISADRGVQFGPVKKLASGGELSRIMLAAKAILCDHTAMPTIIFDEIDAGVSGDVSQKMGKIMEAMSKNLQLIAITHLPQIAARGKQHFKIFKTEKDGKVVTRLKVLDRDERIVEIAEMLSSKEITNTALEHARQLLN
jgi:DNA repair protein RecN (Recombination protein N)